jgi:hypothetical protein
LALALAKNGTETKLAIKFKTSNDMQYKKFRFFSFWKFGVNFQSFVMKDFRPAFLINYSQKMPIPFAGYIISVNMLPRKFRRKLCLVIGVRSFPQFSPKLPN